VSKQEACAAGPWEPITDAPREMDNHVLLTDKHMGQQKFGMFIDNPIIGEIGWYLCVIDFTTCFKDSDFTHFARINKGPTT
jgi:hypothetical protein